MNIKNFFGSLSFDGDNPRNNGTGQLQFGRETNHKYYIYKLWTQPVQHI